MEPAPAAAAAAGPSPASAPSPTPAGHSWQPLWTPQQHLQLTTRRDVQLAAHLRDRVVFCRTRVELPPMHRLVCLLLWSLVKKGQQSPPCQPMPLELSVVTLQFAVHVFAPPLCRVRKDRFSVLGRLSGGGAAHVFAGARIDAQSQERFTGSQTSPLAIKLEPVDRTHKRLHREVQVLRSLQQREPAPLAGAAAAAAADDDPHVPADIRWRFATLVAAGQELGMFNYMITERLGRMSLAQLRRAEHGTLPLPRAALAAREMFTCVTELHRRGYVHCDICADHFVVSHCGTRLSLVSLGSAYDTSDASASLFWDPGHRGNVGLQSSHSHRGAEPHPRDDLESVGYVTLLLLQGHLPWDRAVTAAAAEEGAPREGKRSRVRILVEVKLGYPVEELCAGLPPEMLAYMQYCLALGPEDEPDYTMLEAMWAGLAAREGNCSRLIEDISI
eukprot:TRINITY_DN6794_c0_g1_i1.p1 TRINITY_DN6794_c0_g1~~TRINITY_DN6794_c0_g1_i1.p1  ORF type:complete len:445 (+),score=106.37 TRINITY_DN6794_c0_g1_i1:79-1413(+)